MPTAQQTAITRRLAKLELLELLLLLLLSAKWQCSTQCPSGPAAKQAAAAA
jgi:hypothetical protein